MKLINGIKKMDRDDIVIYALGAFMVSLVLTAFCVYVYVFVLLIW
jgi:hypothetical protein